MKNERKKIEVRFHADTARLYGTIDEAIRYLQEIRDEYEKIRDEYAGTDISLREKWEGYEDMDMTFVYSREETDDEMNDRIKIERKLEKEERERKKERLADLAELERLRNKLGVR